MIFLSLCDINMRFCPTHIPTSIICHWTQQPIIAVEEFRDNGPLFGNDEQFDVDGLQRKLSCFLSHTLAGSRRLIGAILILTEDLFFPLLDEICVSDRNNVEFWIHLIIRNNYGSLLANSQYSSISPKQNNIIINELNIMLLLIGRG